MGADQQLPGPQPAGSGAALAIWLIGMSRYQQPEQLARQAHGTGTTRVFVVTEVDQPLVVAYYAWRMASMASQPIALLARLGVDERHEGQGLGAALLVDVITRVASLSDAIGCRGLLVHAESEQARGFYEHLIPEFERSPTDPLHLLLLLKDIRRTLGR